MCPPLPNGAKYRQMWFWPQRGYNMLNTYTEKLSVTWECNKTLSLPAQINSRRVVNMRNDKRYIVQWEKGATPSGVRMQANVDYSNNVTPGNQEIIFVYPGNWAMSLWNYYAANFWESKPNVDNIEFACACNVTYVKVKTSDNRWGNEIRADYNSSLPCSKTCGNPWPVPDPVGYSCSDPVPTSDNKNLDTCSMAPLTTVDRPWVVQPKEEVYTVDEPPKSIFGGSGTTGNSNTENTGSVSAAVYFEVNIVLLLSIVGLCLFA